MAVFMLNTCTFKDCRITFPTLQDLIYHIEYAHIDHDPIVNQQREASQPASIPLSYAVRFTSEEAIRKYQDSVAVAKLQRQISAACEPVSAGSSTPTDNYCMTPMKIKKRALAEQKNSVSATYSGYEIPDYGSEYEDDDGISQSEDSNDSWTTMEEYSSEFILRYGTRMTAGAMSAGAAGPSVGSTSAIDKPFACPVPGCKKRYKNINGIKYHSKNGHKKDGKVKKGYKCQCGKSYKNVQGLKTHTATRHSTDSAVVVRVGEDCPSPSPHNVNWVLQLYEAGDSSCNASQSEASPSRKRPRLGEPTQVYRAPQLSQ